MCEDYRAINIEVLSILIFSSSRTDIKIFSLYLHINKQNIYMILTEIYKNNLSKYERLLKVRDLLDNLNDESSVVNMKKFIANDPKGPILESDLKEIRKSQAFEVVDKKRIIPVDDIITDKNAFLFYLVPITNYMVNSLENYVMYLHFLSKNLNEKQWNVSKNVEELDFLIRLISTKFYGNETIIIEKINEFYKGRYNKIQITNGDITYPKWKDTPLCKDEFFEKFINQMCIENSN